MNGRTHARPASRLGLSPINTASSKWPDLAGLQALASALCGFRDDGATTMENVSNIGPIRGAGSV
eukprot:1947519-Lingulodinium_polyedra.AAC.1